MKKNISLGITADATGAVAEINKVSKAQGILEDATKAQAKALRETKKGISDVRSYDTLKTSLGFTRGEIEQTNTRLETLAKKQKQHVGLTEAETVSLKQHQNTQKSLNEKIAKNITLTVTEQNRLIKSTSEVERLTKKKTAYVKLTKKEQTEVEKLTVKLSSLNAKEKAQVRTLDELNGKLKKAGLNTNSLSMARSVANRRAEKAAQLLERENRLLARSAALQDRKRQALDSMPSAQMVGAGVLATAGFSARQSMNNEANFVDVAKNVEFKDDTDKAAFRRELNTLAVEMAGVSDADVMKIAAGGANGGIGRDKLGQYTEDTIKTATAWDMTAEEAASKGMALRNSMGYKDDPTTEGDEGRDQFLIMSNMINDVANKNGGVSGKDLLGVMSRRGAQLTNAGFTEQGALALSGALLSKGAAEEEAATATAGITRALVAGENATGSQKEVYEKLGMDSESVAEGMQTDAMGTLTGVLDAINDLDAVEQSSTISKLFGEEAAPHVQKILKDTQTLKKIQGDALAAEKDYQKAKTDPNAVDSITAEYNNIASTNKAKFEETGKALNNLAIALGDRLMPMLDPVLGVTTDIAMGLADFVNDGGAAVDILLGIGAAVLTVGAANTAIKGMKAVKNIVGIGKETLALNAAAKATEKHTKALERQAAASERAARNGGARDSARRDSGRSRKPSRSRRRGGKLAALSGVGTNVLNRLSTIQSSESFQRVQSSTLETRAGSRRKKGMLGMGVGALSLLAAPAFAGGVESVGGDALATAADTAGAAGDITGGLGKASKLANAAKFIRPLSLGLDALSLGSQVANGDAKGVAQTGGGILGGMGGAALGATIGSFILPGIGTAVGGAIGGMVGDGIGANIGESIFNWFSSDELPDKTEEIKKVQEKQAIAKQAAPTTFAPVLTVEGTSDPQETAALTIDAMRAMFEQWQREQAADIDQDIAHSLGD